MSNLLYYPIITGPTAVGKSELSLALSERINGAIICADSRQVYKYINIGTAKPSKEDRIRVPHVLFDIYDLQYSYSVVQYADDICNAINKCIDDNLHPVITGGSTLYIHALTHGFPSTGPPDSSLREELKLLLAKDGLIKLQQRLSDLDPKALSQVDQFNPIRVIRAIEIVETSGLPLRDAVSSPRILPFSFKLFVLSRPRQELYDRINKRVDTMVQSGLIGEVQAFVDCGLANNPILNRTIGYQEPLAFIRGEITYENMIHLLKRNTRRYAKRQLTWFRNKENPVWIDAKLPLNTQIDLIIEHLYK